MQAKTKMPSVYRNDMENWIVVGSIRYNAIVLTYQIMAQ